jgi:predicted transcriptional regulator
MSTTPQQRQPRKPANLEYLTDVVTILDTCQGRITKYADLINGVKPALHHPDRFDTYINELVEAELLSKHGLHKFKTTMQGSHQLKNIKMILTTIEAQLS